MLFGPWAGRGNSSSGWGWCSAMTLEVFYVDGCPNLQRTLNRVKQVLDETGLTANVVEQRMLDASSAAAMRFLGSPTVHVNGVDVEPSARTSDQFGLTCRMYVSG